MTPPTPVLALDHVGFVARDLGPLLAMFRRLGFAPTAPASLARVSSAGASESLGQSSAHIILGSTYVELTAVTGPAEASHLGPWLGRREGLHILALRGPDLDDGRATAVAAGFHPTPVQDARRQITYGRRQGQARFRWWMLPAREFPEALVCQVDNLTPELVYQPEVQHQPNGVLDLAGVLVSSADRPEGLRRWGRALGLNPDADGFALVNGRLGFAAHSAPQLQPPGLVGVEFLVADLDAVRALAAATGWLLPGPPAATLTARLPAPANALVRFRAPD